MWIKDELGGIIRKVQFPSRTPRRPKPWFHSAQSLVCWSLESRFDRSRLFHPSILYMSLRTTYGGMAPAHPSPAAEFEEQAAVDRVGYALDLARVRGE